MLKRAGPDGMSKVVNEFTNNHPEISKRQTELKVFEVAVKEKQQDDTKQVKGNSTCLLCEYVIASSSTHAMPCHAIPSLLSYLFIQLPLTFPLTLPSTPLLSLPPFRN